MFIALSSLSLSHALSLGSLSHPSFSRSPARLSRHPRQETLHHNICRQRTLASVGTHDLDSVKGPFTYEARRPEDIKFKPLKQDKEFRGDELIHFYETDEKGKDIKPYVHIIKVRGPQ